MSGVGRCDTRLCTLFTSKYVPSLLIKPPDGKENVATTGWESQLDASVLEQRRQRILQILNTGSLKDLKGLQQIGDKKAKLILGWREIHGHFTKVGSFTPLGFCGAAAPAGATALITLVALQLDDLVKVEGMTEKRFSSFKKASILLKVVTATFSRVLRLRHLKI